MPDIIPKSRISSVLAKKLRCERERRERVAARLENRQRAVAKAKRTFSGSTSDHVSDMVDSTIKSTTDEEDSIVSPTKSPVPKAACKKKRAIVDLVDEDESSKSSKSTTASLTADMAKLGEPEVKAKKN